MHFASRLHDDFVACAGAGPDMQLYTPEYAVVNILKAMLELILHA